MTHVALTYLDRAAWGANPSLPRLGHVVSRAKFRGLALHHTVSVLRDWDGDGVLHGDLDDIGRFMRQLQTARPDLGADVPYSFVVFRGASDQDAVICEGRGWERTGAHTPGHNSTRWGVALAGNYTSEPPTPGQLEAIRWIGRQLADPAGARSTIGHRDVKATACPGDCAYPLMALVQPPFGLDLEELLMSTSAFQLVGSDGHVRLFVPGQRSVSLGGLGGPHERLAHNAVAPLLGPAIPAQELDEFARRWDVAVG